MNHPRNDSYLVGTPPTSLLDIMPDPMTNNGIFTYLETFPFISPQENNMEYLFNRSGDKIPSPLVSRLADGDTLTTVSLQSIANIIKARFQYKWQTLWREYSSNSSIFNNVSLNESTTYGKETESSGTDTLTKSGSETHSLSGSEIESETFPTARSTRRTITGGWSDDRTLTNTRTGIEDVTESYPTTRTSTKSITGSYKDEDTTASTRTGTQIVTDKGDTTTTGYGFNSSSGVKLNKVGPDNATTGTTQETSYGANGVKDAHSGDITRTYTNYQEATAETGSRKVATTYGEDGLVDDQTGNASRTYNNYVDETTESGQRRVEKSYGVDGKQDSLSFNNRQDENRRSSSVSNSGTDTTTTTGYNIRDFSDKADLLKLMYTDPSFLNFYDVIYSDIDEVLTIPVFAY